MKVGFIRKLSTAMSIKFADILVFHYRIKASRHTLIDGLSAF